jgi:hypothetical protein
MNSIDEQHMRTVHKLDIDLKLKITEGETRFKTEFTGKVQTNTWVGKVQRFFLGEHWGSSVIFVDGCLGLLTTMIDVKLFKRFPMPRGQFIFSQTFIDPGKTVVYPIVVIERYDGFFGALISLAMLMFFKITMIYLAFQDGHVIYHQLRFWQNGLLAENDLASAKWINWVNKKVQPSIWSKATLQKSQSETEEVVASL